MTKPVLYPFHDAAATLMRFSKIPLHQGKASVRLEESADLRADVLVPAEGDCLIFLHGARKKLPRRGVGSGLTISGDSADGPFELTCPLFHIKASSPLREKLEWAILSPANQPMTIDYKAQRPAAKVSAIINNFDFEGVGLSVDASGRTVQFARCNQYERLRELANTDILRTPALTSFSFDVWAGASEQELMTFAQDVASLCAYAVGQHTGVTVLSLFDQDGQVIRRIIGNPVESRFKRGGILNNSRVPDGITKLFSQCFEEHVKMRRSSLPWIKLPSYCATIEDLPYLEERFAVLMIAIEFFIKNSLIESRNAMASRQIEKMDFNALIAAARSILGWRVPKHYTKKDLPRLLRNAIMHGGELPTKDSAEFRHVFDKWLLFLYRRVLMRLGYDGIVVSPQGGWVSTSPVSDFSEAHNSFSYSSG